MRAPLRLALVLAVASLTACAFFRKLAGRDTVDLEKAEMRSMGVDLRRSQKTICPREKVQLAVFAEVVLDGEKEVRKVETWQGTGGESRNDKLDFEDFAFQSADGAIDPATGWFSPNPSLLATVARELEIRTAWKRRPDKFTFATTYKPDYDCIRSTGRNGSAGAAGAAGSSGAAGSPGSSGSYSYSYSPPSSPGGVSTSTSQQGPGGNGGNGSPGGPGGRGSDGGPGIHLEVQLALVKTAFYDKLVAARITGDVDDVLFFPPEIVLQIHAAGGSGGAGGAGGRGGQGGSGGSGNPPGQSGQKGADGPGGPGGSGGAGGIVDLVFDPRFESELRAAIHADASGGAGGPGGAGGGASGSHGPQGRVSFRPGDLKKKLADLPGVTVL